jgi:hypothetical protein
MVETCGKMEDQRIKQLFSKYDPVGKRYERYVEVLQERSFLI